MDSRSKIVNSLWVNQPKQQSWWCVYTAQFTCKQLLKQFPPARIVTSQSHSPSKHKTSEVQFTEQVCQIKKNIGSRYLSAGSQQCNIKADKMESVWLT